MDQFKTAMTSWVELKTQLKEARKDLSVLSTREKELQKVIKTYMGSQEIDTVNVLNKKVNFKKRLAKGSITKAVIRKGLINYFGQEDETQIDGIFQAIMDAAPSVERQSLTLT